MRFAATLLLGLLGAGCAYPSLGVERPASGRIPPARVERVPLPPTPDEALTNLPALPLVRLQGDGYARGRQYGEAFAEAWRHAVAELERYAVRHVREYVPPKLVARFVVRQYTAHVAQRFGRPSDPRAEELFPGEYRAYVQGIADGAGLEAGEVQRTIALIMLADAGCSAFAAFGPATDDGRLLQMRNLDWGEESLRVAEKAVLLVHEPPGGQRYLSIGFVGLVGSISGVNESGISISEIGAETDERSQRGLPMPLLLERVLAEARTLDEAVRILRTAPGTGGYNFIVGSARERRAAVVEKTAHLCAVFEVSEHNYRDNPYFQGFAGFDCRADTAADPRVRRHQRCSRGGDEPPVGSRAYEERYRRQVELFEGWGRKLDVARAQALAEAVAPDNNLQSVLYDFSRHRVYVRNRAWFADGRTDVSKDEEMRLRAAAQPPAVLDLRRVFPPRAPRGR